MVEPKTSIKRQYYIDWIRIILIISVFFFHIGMVFNGKDWLIKNDQLISSVDPFMDFLHQWRMPLLFMVSGVGTRFALSKRTIRQYLQERTIRLLVPFLCGMILLVPIQGYYENIEQYSSLAEFYYQFFYKTFVTLEFTFRHLWFLLYLFFISCFFAPFIYFYRSYKFDIFEKWLERRTYFPGLILVFSAPILFSQFILLKCCPSESMLLYNDWAYFSLNFIYFIYGFILIGNQKIVSYLVRDRYFYLVVVIVTSFVFHFWEFPLSPKLELVGHYTNKYVMSWAICLAILAFARKYMNRDHPARKSLNISIYPFYLLQQSVIVVLAYYIVQLDLNIATKIVLLIVFCLLFIVLLYKIIIAPFNFLRIIFGMKKKREKKSILARLIHT